MTQKNRIIWVDNAKGIAMILVIIGHTYTGLQSMDFAFVYGIHLVMFFLISGYMLRPHNLTLAYITQKLTHLMLPYFLTCGAVLLMDLFNGRKDASIDNQTGIIYKDILKIFFSSGGIKTIGSIELGYIGAIWFLPAMFFSIVLFQLIYSHTGNDLKAGVICACLAIIGNISASFIWFPFSLQSSMMAVFFIWMGFEINYYRILEKVRWFHFFLALFILLYGIHFGYCAVFFHNAKISDWIISIFVGLAGCLEIFLLSKLNTKGKILSYIGKNSMTVLCVHLFILNTCNNIYISRLLNSLNLQNDPRVWARIFFNIFFSVIGTILVNLFLKAYNIVSEYGKRTFTIYAKQSIIPEIIENNLTADLLQGIFILFIITCNFRINAALSTLMNSVHMIGLIFLSGYLFQNRDHPIKTFYYLCRTMLLPYILCSCLEILIIIFKNIFSYNRIILCIQKYLLALSYTNKFFSNAPLVGPVFFISMLFCISLLYLLIDNFRFTSGMKFFVLVCISLVGFHLGDEGYYLPWSFDIACYAIIFYASGVLARKYQVLNYIRERPFLYFILSPIWAYIIYKGGIAITVRNYGQYGLSIIGSLCGIFTIYSLSCFFVNHLFIIPSVISLIGQRWIYILVTHTILNSRIIRILDYIGFHEGYIWNMIIAMTFQITVGIILGIIIERIRYIRIKKGVC